MAAPQQRRRDLHAGPVGVPLVRRVGPGLPLRPDRPRRPGVRQEPADPDAARVVHAPEWADPGVRVGPVFGDTSLFQTHPDWHDLLPFHEYFHGDTGRGVGASHQTGWTALVAHLVM